MTSILLMPFSLIIWEMAAIPSLAFTEKSSVVIISANLTVAGSLPSATTFETMSHSVTKPAGCVGESMTTKPCLADFIVFAASRTVVSFGSASRSF